MKKKLTSTISTRVSTSTKTKFNQRAKKYGDPAYLLRELILAFVEDRLTIKAPENSLFNQGE